MEDLLPMDISGLDLTFLLSAFGTGAAAFIKAFRSDSNAKKANAEIDAINRDRENTALARDAQAQEMKTEIEVLKKIVSNHEKQLADGMHEFESIRSELKEQNGLLREILGALKIKFNLPIDGNGTL
jgi:hypothetical protein